jgi:hypothetical protein
MDKPLNIEVLLAWGRDWQRHLEAGPGCGFHMSALVLLQYVTTANEGLELLKRREARVIKRSGGRPRGTGMGGQAAALIASGVREEDAVRMITAHHGKPADKVRDALRRYRAGQS